MQSLGWIFQAHLIRFLEPRRCAGYHVFDDFSSRQSVDILDVGWCIIFGEAALRHGDGVVISRRAAAIYEREPGFAAAALDDLGAEV
jgi:hypothetical protein